MVISTHRPTKIIVDKRALQLNIKNEIKRMDKNQELFAVVKANGYGHGAIVVAQAAQQAGAKGFCVATLDEAIELRKAGFVEPVIVLGVVDTAYLSIASQYDIAIPVGTMEWLEEAQNFLSETNINISIKLHIAIDTGMGRIGFLNQKAVHEAIDFINKQDQMMIEGIFTHFATADEKKADYWQEQIDKFETIIDSLSELPRYVHASNSAAALWHKPIGNMIRFGQAMYGLNPSGTELIPPYELVPALSLVSRLTQVKELPQGSYIGYGAAYQTTKAEWIGTVPIGYADGYIRQMEGFEVLVEGQKCEIIGRVCMDQLMIRLPKEMKAGSLVTLIGRQENQVITVQDVAQHMDTINYEVVCLLSERLPREYI